MPKLRKHPHSAFSLIEAMLSLALSSVIAVGIFQLLRGQAKTTGNQSANSQVLRNAQRAKFLLKKDISQAGFDPRFYDADICDTRSPCQALPAITTASDDQIVLQADFDMGGTIANPEGGETETFEYAYDADNRQVTRNGQPFLIDVDSFSLTYKDANDAEISPAPGSDATLIANVKKVQVKWSQPVGDSKVSYEDFTVFIRNFKGSS